MSELASEFQMGGRQLAGPTKEGLMSELASEFQMGGRQLAGPTKEGQ